MLPEIAVAVREAARQPRRYCLKRPDMHRPAQTQTDGGVTEMSYPDPVYLGEPGLVNATFRPSDHEPELRYRSGGSVHYLATGESTSGQFGLYRWEMAAAQSGPDPHFHRSISESFYVLTGTIRLYDGTDWKDGRPGDFLFVPEGGLHGFRTIGRTGVDADPVRSRRAARGLLRDACAGRRRPRDDRGRARGFHGPPRYVLALTRRPRGPCVGAGNQTTRVD